MNFTEQEVEVVKNLLEDCIYLASEYSTTTEKEDVIAMANKVGYEISSKQIGWLHE